MGIFVPTSGCSSELAASCYVTEMLSQCILDAPTFRFILSVCYGLDNVRGASNWLTTLPLNEHSFALHKSDALACWPPLHALFCVHVESPF